MRAGGYAALLMVWTGLLVGSGALAGDAPAPLPPIRVGIDRDYPPHESVDDLGRVRGFNVDVVRACARKLGRRVEWHPMVWADAVRALREGRVDMLCMAYSRQRAREFTLSREVLLNVELGIFVRRRTSGVTGLADLAQRTVGVQQNDISQEELARACPQAHIVAVASQGAALELLERGEVFAVFGNVYNAHFEINTRDLHDIKQIGETTTLAPRVFAFRAGDTAQRDQWDDALRRIKNDGEMRRLMEKWFGRVTPRLVSLQTIWTLLYVLAGLVLLLLASLTLIALLRRAVRIKTQDLRKSAVEWKETFDAMHEAVLAIDAGGKVARANRQACELTRRDAADLEGKPCGDVLPAFRPGPEVPDDLCGQVRAGKACRFEAQIESYPGRSFQVDAVPMTQAGPGGCGGLILIRDVSDRRQAENALIASEHRYRQLFESGNDPVLILRGDWLVHWNARALEFLDATPEALCGKTIMDFTAAEAHEVALLLERIERATHGEPQRFEWRFCSLAGRSLLADVSLSRVVVDEQECAQAVIRDITEKKRAEEAIRERQQQLSSLVETMPACVFIVRDGRVVFLNQFLCDVLGASRETLINSRLGPLVVESDRMLVEEAVERVTAGEERLAGLEARFAAARGTPRLLELFISPIPFNGIPSCLLTAIDVTERRDLERRLVQAEKIEAVGNMAQSIAHDFNNLLMGILGTLDIIKGQGTADAGTLGELTHIETAVRRAYSLITNLLSFARAEAEGICCETNVNEIVSEVVALLQHMIEKHMAIEVHLDEDVCPVWMDPTHMHQILMNLAVNARDAINTAVESGAPREHSIQIRTQVVTPETDARTGQPNTRPYLLLTFRDTGCGMTPETRDRMFDPFFSTKKSGKGTGLGLTTVYRLVTRYGGWIDVETAPDAGACFRIYLPCCAASPAAPPPGPAALEGTLRVLVVEDDPVIRRGTEAYLSKNGFTVRTAANADEALRAFDEEGSAFDAVVIDYSLPGTDGIALARKLADRRPGLRLVLTSGYDEASLRLDEEGLTNVIFIQKPYVGETLAARIRGA